MLGTVVYPEGLQRGTVSLVIVWNDQNKKPLRESLSWLLSLLVFVEYHALYSDLRGREGLGKGSRDIDGISSGR